MSPSLGCSCKRCSEGQPHGPADEALIARGLAHAGFQPARLVAIDGELRRAIVCHGYQNGCVCGCGPNSAEPKRASRMAQPWQVRPAKRAAA